MAFCVAWIVLVLFTRTNIILSATTEESEEVSQLTVLVNETVALPCAISKQSVDDIAVIILWYKGSSPAPFYSYDLRQRDNRHWSDETVLGQRANYDPKLNPPSLTVTPVRETDQDTYRCRVDYEKGPSKTSTVLLVVIVPPSPPVITDEKGNVVKDTAGPYLEGGRVILTCRTIGGRPSPMLLWMRNGEIVEDGYTVDNVGRVKNILHLDSLSRKLLDTTYTCRATNSNITRPLDSTIAINLTLAPLTISLVKITGAEEFVSAETIEELECSSAGSRPDPMITWYRDSRRISNPRAKETKLLNKTISTLRFVPKPEDHGVLFTCRVENILLPSSVQEESYKLNVHYIPRVKLLMGMGLSPQSVREGSDIFFECRVVANPKLYKTTWVHEGTVIEHNVTGGVIISNMSLVLQKVGRNRAGRYYCRATNLHGEGVSNPIPITVMYSPVCSSGQKTEYQVAHHETANITCQVDAVPDNVTFTWRFNSSGSLLELAQGRAASWGTSSVLPYTPASPGDYGLLLCSATNAQGLQHNPCVFNITASKPPDLLEDCIIKNQTTNTLYVSCKGIPTVLPRTFTMEVRNSEDLNLITKVTNTTPHFIAKGLDPGTGYTLHVGVISPMGASTPVKLQAFTVKTAEKRMGMIQPAEEMLGVFPMVGVIVGAAITFVITLVTIVALAIKHCPRDRQDGDSRHQYHHAPGSSLVSDTSPKETLSTFSRPSPASEDRNPDIIPLKDECDYQLEELRVPSCQVVGGTVGPCHQLPTSQSASGPYVTPMMASGAVPYQQQQQNWDPYYQQQHILQYHQHHHQHPPQSSHPSHPSSSNQVAFRPSHEPCQQHPNGGPDHHQHHPHHQQQQQQHQPQILIQASSMSPYPHSNILPPPTSMAQPDVGAGYGSTYTGGHSHQQQHQHQHQHQQQHQHLTNTSFKNTASGPADLRSASCSSSPVTNPRSNSSASSNVNKQLDCNNGDNCRHESSV